MNKTILKIMAHDRAPSGWSAVPMGEIVSENGFITDVVFMSPPPIAEGWIKRTEDGGVIVGATQQPVRWAYRFRDKDGEIHIVGDMELWCMWEGLHDYQY